MLLGCRLYSPARLWMGPASFITQVKRWNAYIYAALLYKGMWFLLVANSISTYHTASPFHNTTSHPSSSTTAMDPHIDAPNFAGFIECPVQLHQAFHNAAISAISASGVFIHPNGDIVARDENALNGYLSVDCVLPALSDHVRHAVKHAVRPIRLDPWVWPLSEIESDAQLSVWWEVEDALPLNLSPSLPQANQDSLLVCSVLLFLEQFDPQGDVYAGVRLRMTYRIGSSTGQPLEVSSQHKLKGREAKQVELYADHFLQMQIHQADCFGSQVRVSRDDPVCLHRFAHTPS